MSWHFSRALVAEFSAASCLAGGRYAPWNSTPFAPDDSCSDKMKGICHRSQFGTMYVPFTDASGADLLTWFREGSLARISRQEELVSGLKVNGLGCGWKWPESSMKYDPDSRLWKTRQTSLFGDLEPYLETWPRWGTMRDGESWERSTLVPRTKEIESGLWLTPRVTEIIETPENFRARMNGKRKNDRKNGFSSLSMQIGGRWNPTWAEWLMGWPMMWTEPVPLATDKFQQWLRSHGKY